MRGLALLAMLLGALPACSASVARSSSGEEPPPPSPQPNACPSLNVVPAPDEAVRVMMIRVEVITPEVEALDAAAIGLLGDPAYAQALLASIASVDTRAAAGE